MEIKEVLPYQEELQVYKDRLRSVLFSRPWHWLSPTERKWRDELEEEDDER